MQFQSFNYLHISVIYKYTHTQVQFFYIVSTALQLHSKYSFAIFLYSKQQNMEKKKIKILVLIIGAGPAGLATSACLKRLNIPNIVVEREDCSASLWKRRSYDRLKLHLAKQFCQLPHMPFPSNTPTFVSKVGFINYLDEYATRFNINPRHNRNVKSASFKNGRWIVEVEKAASVEREVYSAKYVVSATGENGEGVIPGIVESFEGEYLHSSEYKNGEKFAGKDVLVVGCGNSGMEIAYDLSKSNAKVSIVVRSPVSTDYKK